MRPNSIARTMRSRCAALVLPIALLGCSPTEHAVRAARTIPVPESGAWFCFTGKVTGVDVWGNGLTSAYLQMTVNPGPGGSAAVFVVGDGVPVAYPGFVSLVTGAYATKEPLTLYYGASIRNGTQHLVGATLGYPSGNCTDESRGPAAR